MRIGTRPWVAVAFVCLLLTPACREGSPRAPEDPSLGRILVQDPPQGFVLVPGSSGSLGLTEASVAITYADPAESRKLLETAGFQAGESRVWSKDEDFASVYVYRLEAPLGAQQLLDFALQALRAQPSANVFKVPAVTGATGYVLSGVARKGKRTLFCQGVWFIRGERAFNQNTCSSAHPSDNEDVVSLARAQDAAVSSP